MGVKVQYQNGTRNCSLSYVIKTPKKTLSAPCYQLNFLWRYTSWILTLTNNDNMNCWVTMPVLMVLKSLQTGGITKLLSTEFVINRMSITLLTEYYVRKGFESL